MDQILQNRDKKFAVKEDWKLVYHVFFTNMHSNHG